ncbi:AraC family transcriptional regulator [Haloechinothrix sp. LS1_15]|uniref:AraC family transcriptional regulator n=1 Tax=Haloechinothrix sp. LS1_15 TaxID=2652248 RepID=UPI00294403D5|nr:AraC family transcriptional regulator [Haloechinothrix sp. LS1_15]MDV6012845.1 AraC family transcriptional regulator [Haloechinothrix sp. LS1_15]
MPNDPLGEALHPLQVSGVFYCHSEATAPWGVTLPPMPGCLWFHVVTAGRALIDRTGEPTREIRPGELVLVPHGGGHVLRSESATTTPAVDTLDHEYIGQSYAMLRHGGGGAPATLICGAVRIDHPAWSELLELLPCLLHVIPEPGRLHSTLGLMAAEARQRRPGGETVITRLCDILIVQALRTWLDTDPGTSAGWLAALRDPRIGTAISLIHRQPEKDWTVASLAAELAMSRSAFAARFTELAGQPVMHYITRRRMHLALSRLRDGTATVAELAHSLGYRSESAFSRAFKRVVGIPPGVARTTNPSGGGDPPR